jgi:hypothetical protein
MARITFAIAACGAVLAAAPAAAQEDKTGAVPALPLVAPAPYDSSTAPVEAVAPKAEPAATAAENPPAGKTAQNGMSESKPDDGNAEAKAPEKADARFTFNRVGDDYVRLDNRTGQVSVCNKRTVGWTCQLVPEDRTVLENEIGRLQEENSSLKRELLTNGLPLPGSMKGEPPVAQKERPFGLPSEQNIDRMKAIVEKAWRRLVEIITTLQKDVMKKS